MGIFLSKPSQSATTGEKMFFNRADYYFTNSNDVIGYFEPYIGEFHPDYLLLSPKYGIFIVEIKDYSAKHLRNISKSGEWEKLNGDGLFQIKNPFDQMHKYWRAVKDRINHCDFPKGLKIPIIRLVVFSQISNKSQLAKEIIKICPLKIHIAFKEVMSRNTNFREFFTNLLPLDFSLSNDEFTLLRGNLIPFSRLPTYKQADLLKYFSSEDQIKLLDREQERIARELGEGHRLIFGVAGSGKTVLLIARARIMAKLYPDWKILILCYNRLLRDSLIQLLNPQDYDTDITIDTFHSWAKKFITSGNNNFTNKYDEAYKKAEKNAKITEFFQTTVPNLLIDMLNSSSKNNAYYDAILIDEAQDFDQNWFLPVIQVLNPETNSLLITCDGLQGIYARKRFTWASIGIQARGRVKRFEKSYRVPIEIGVAAREALPENLITLIDQYDEFISTKEYSGAHGIIEIIISKSRDEEYKALIEKISHLLKAPQEILLLFRRNMQKIGYEHPFFDQLKALNIEWKDLKEYHHLATGLYVGTLHGTKGLESDTIIIPEVDTYKTDKDRQLLYVGMTRSRKKLVLSANKSTELIKLFEPYPS
jgi:superfamily I DNA and RNA helicase